MERTPNGLIIPDRELLSELVAQPPLPVTMPVIAGGVTFSAKMASDFFLTDPSLAVADLQDQPRVLIVDQGMLVEPLVALVDEAAMAARALVVVAPAFDEMALGILIVNKLRGFIWTAAIEADAATQQAIARHVGGTVVSSFEGVTFATLAVAKRVVASRESIVIVA